MFNNNEKFIQFAHELAASIHEEIKNQLWFHFN